MIEHSKRTEYGKLGAASRWGGDAEYELRFWKRVDICGLNDCWNWKSSISKKTGYGKCKRNGKHTSAHRMAHILTHGDIKNGLHVLHRCDNRPCCNPSHLFLGTHKDNMADAASKGRTWRGAVPPGLKGSESACSKIKESDAAAIRLEYSSGNVTQAALGRKYCIGQDQISRIVNRKQWAHVI